MNSPRVYLYSQQHIWIEIGKAEACMGITNYAQSRLEDIIVMDTVKEGSELKKGELFGRIESVRKSFDMVMPVDGKITEINQRVEANPGLINHNPYFQGWIVKVLVTDMKQLDDLLLVWKYMRMIKKQEHE